jgi:5-oxopent-3-ene-1,2,5-tricarboxylate decarboxylase/2-hydroxyhepta-2,4-diene-1,7-dioate isomerase
MPVIVSGGRGAVASSSLPCGGAGLASESTGPAAFNPLIPLRFRGLVQTAPQTVNMLIMSAAPELRHGRERAAIAPVDGSVYGVVLNFRADIDALGDALRQPPYLAPPRAPVLYVKPANTWSADGDDIPLPAGAELVQVAATLALVIGRVACRVDASRALAHVASVRVVNDVTLPHASVYRPAIRERCRDGFCPMGGPVAVTDLAALLARARFRTRINGAVQQDTGAEMMVRAPASLLAAVSDFMTLLPGDLLLLGAPRQSPTARAGDVVTVEVDEVGSLENRIVRSAEQSS